MQLQEILKHKDSIQIQQELSLLRKGELFPSMLKALEWEAESKEKRILAQPTENSDNENFEKGYARALRRVPRLLAEVDEFLKTKQ